MSYFEVVEENSKRRIGKVLASPERTENTRLRSLHPFSAPWGFPSGWRVTWPPVLRFRMQIERRSILFGKEKRNQKIVVLK